MLKMRSLPFNVSVSIAAICHGSSASMTGIAVSLSNEAVSHRGQSLGGKSCVPEDMIGIIKGAALLCDWNAA